MNILVIHAKNLTEKDEIDFDYKQRLDKAIELANNQNLDKIIILGGYVRKAKISQAKAGETYLKDKVKLPIMLEEKSITSIENLVNLKQLISENDILTVVSSDYHNARLVFLYSKYIPNKKIFIGATSNFTGVKKLVELVYLGYAKVDSREKYLSKWLKFIRK